MFKTQIFDGKAKTLALSGKLDTTSAPTLESEGITLISKGCRSLVINLAGLEYISSAGLRAILTIAKKIMPLSGKMVLCSPTGVVKNVLSISGFDTIRQIPLQAG